MTEISKSVDAYAFGANPEMVVGAISNAIGEPFSCECVGDFRFYKISECQLVVNPSESGYFCYSLVDCDLWRSDVEFARFLAGVTGRSVRCDPGSMFPEVWAYSDTFLQIENGVESLIEWRSDYDE
jgi:hypothetical protein